MIGLLYIPQKTDLEKAYEKLLYGKVSEAEVALFSQWCRFDARLAEILVKFIGENWTTINPIMLNAEMKIQPWAASIGVILGFAENMVGKKNKTWKCWKNLVVVEIQSAPFEQYFIGWTKLASPTMIQSSEMSLLEYKNWGYLSQEVLFNKAPSQNFKTHSYSFESRKKIILELLKKNKTVSIKDYMKELGSSISVRTAERDFHKIKQIKKIGVTNGAKYKISS